jgi:hypothetical protein
VRGPMMTATNGEDIPELVTAALGAQLDVMQILDAPASPWSGAVLLRGACRNVAEMLAVTLRHGDDLCFDRDELAARARSIFQ